MYLETALHPSASTDFASHAICHGLSRQAAVRVASLGTFQKVAAGKTVFSEGDDAECIYEVVRGMLRLYKLLPDGRRQITGFLSAGHILGLAHDRFYIYAAEAITEVTLCRYSRTHFDRFVDELPGFARRLLAVTSDELRAAQDQMLLLGRKTAMEKIASFLLMMAERQSDEAATDEVQIPMGRSDIADYLGLTTETVSRVLAKLKGRGAIKLPTPARIALSDRDQLEELAAGELTEDS